jgi:glycosyltransferase involved in cell wall biosynthesis
LITRHAGAAGRPLVSVIIATYNRAGLVRATLDSVAAQEHRPVEVIVVDDASTDETTAVVEQARVDLEQAGISLQVRIRATNGGPAAAFNTGLALARGHLVSFLGSDDFWRPRFLQTMIDLLERYADCGVAFSGVEAVDGEGTVLYVRDPEIEDPSVEGVLCRPLDRLVAKFPFATSGSVITRDVLDAVGTFDEDVRVWEDADLWYRVARETDFAYTRVPLLCYRIHEGNLTSKRKYHASHYWRDILVVALRYADQIGSPRARAVLTSRVQEAQLLLQEQLLREGRRDPALEPLLENPFAPTSLRYRVGRALLRAPRWVGRSYAQGIRLFGNARRRTSRFIRTSVVPTATR